MSEKSKNVVTVSAAALFLLIFFLWSLLKPASAVSGSERRKLAQFPTLSMDTVLSGKFMTGFESYTLDQFPLRDSFRTLKASTVFYGFAQKDNNKIYIRQNQAAKLEYPLNEDSIARAGERFRFLYDSLMAGTDVNVYLSVIPDKNCFMAQEGGYPSIDYDAFIQKMREQADYMQYIGITDLLGLDDYYHTDIHWRQEEIVDVAQRLAEGMGVSLSAQYDRQALDQPFYGVYYGQSALPLPPEELFYLTSGWMENCTVFDFESNSSIPFYDMAKAAGQDPYELFLSGPLSLITIDNPQASTDRELVLFRDSFSSSLAPLLAEGYARITLVDIRYLSSHSVGKFITFDDQDVLFLYSVPVLNNSITLK